MRNILFDTFDMFPERVGFALFIVVVMLAVLIVPAASISVVWNFAVPDVFAGLVQKGVLLAHLDLLQALKFEVLFAVLIGTPVMLFLVIAGGISSLLNGYEHKEESKE